MCVSASYSDKALVVMGIRHNAPQCSLDQMFRDHPEFPTIMSSSHQMSSSLRLEPTWHLAPPSLVQVSHLDIRSPVLLNLMCSITIP